MPRGMSRAGIAGLLGRGRHDVEADEREEHDRGAGDDPAPAERRGREAEQALDQRRIPARGGLARLRRGHERAVVAGVQVEDAHRDDEQHDGHLDGDHDRVVPGRQLDAEHEHSGHRQGEHHRGDVEPRLLAGDRRGEFEPDVAEHLLQVARPAHRDGRGPDGELEDQVPADDPGDELTERGVGERVGGAGDRHGRGELGVAERGEAADDPGDDEREPPRPAPTGSARPHP